MLQRPLTSLYGQYAARTALAAIALAQVDCGSASSDESTVTTRAAILGGQIADVGSPELYLAGPEGACTATLIAPQLVVTARHCIAHTVDGAFACSPAGDLLATGSGAGEIGADYPPAALRFFSAQSVGSKISSGPADAVGTQILSTLSPTACRDDLAFVVLDRSIAGLIPAPVRIDRATAVGELMSVFGYGLTGVLEPTALRKRDGVPVLAVGPDVAVDSTQDAPVRAIRIGPITCLGDSGGPMIATTGAIIAVVSLGSSDANRMDPTGAACALGMSPTTGARLAAYRDLVLTAFRAAGATPLLETATMADSGESPEESSTADAATAITIYRPVGGACAVRPGDGASGRLAGVTAAAALTAIIRRRRR